jgi:hypothetical protein
MPSNAWHAYTLDVYEHISRKVAREVQDMCYLVLLYKKNLPWIDCDDIALRREYRDLHEIE